MTLPHPQPRPKKALCVGSGQPGTQDCYGIDRPTNLLVRGSSVSHLMDLVTDFLFYGCFHSGVPPIQGQFILSEMAHLLRPVSHSTSPVFWEAMSHGMVAFLRDRRSMHSLHSYMKPLVGYPHPTWLSREGCCIVLRSSKLQRGSRELKRDPKEFWHFSEKAAFGFKASGYIGPDSRHTDCGGNG